MALGKPEFGGNVADVDIEDPIAIHIGEVATHALEGILSEHARLWSGETAAPLKLDELEMTGGRTIMKEAIGTEIVCEINFRQEIAIEISGAKGDSQAAGNFSR